MASSETSDEPTDSSEKPADRGQRQTLVIVVVVLAWTYVYNLFVKRQGPVKSFFQMLDTISDDFVVGSLLTIAAGMGIVAVFSFTKLYSQIIANIHSFKIIEDLVYSDLRQGHVKRFLRKLLTFRDQPLPSEMCPRHVSSLLLSLTFIYVMSWIYVILFSEALFFVAWSAGVDLPITAHNMLFMPTLALAIPFSARVMAYLRYPYAQDYADFMPGAVFVYLLVTALGFLFESNTQNFFLVRVYADPVLWATYLRNDAFLAFIPVFFEAAFWLLALNSTRSANQQDR